MLIIYFIRILTKWRNKVSFCDSVDRESNQILNTKFKESGNSQNIIYENKELSETKSDDSK